MITPHPDERAEDLVEEITPDVEPGWSIRDQHDAEWAAGRVMAAREHLARVTRNYLAAIEAAKRELAADEAFFLPQLEAWAKANPPRKGKSIRLAEATLSFRTVPGGPRVVDAERALTWARQHYPAAVRVREELDKEAIKGYVAESGELPDGVERVPAEERFGVK